EVLREPFADPLLVIIPPADRLAPPLMRELVREKELGERAEGNRIVSPVQRRRRERLIQRGKIAGTVTAGQVVLDQRNGEARIRRVAEQGFVERRDVGGARDEIAAAIGLPRVRLDRQ